MKKLEIWKHWFVQERFVGHIVENWIECSIYVFGFYECILNEKCFHSVWLASSNRRGLQDMKSPDIRPRMGGFQAVCRFNVSASKRPQCHGDNMANFQFKVSDNCHNDRIKMSQTPPRPKGRFLFITNAAKRPKNSKELLFHHRGGFLAIFGPMTPTLWPAICPEAIEEYGAFFINYSALCIRVSFSFHYIDT